MLTHHRVLPLVAVTLMLTGCMPLPFFTQLSEALRPPVDQPQGLQMVVPLRIGATGGTGQRIKKAWTSTVFSEATSNKLDRTFRQVAAIRFDRTGNLWMLDTGYLQVRKLSPSGQLTTVLASNEEGVPYDFRYGVGISFDIDDKENAYIPTGEAILKVSSSGQATRLTPTLEATSANTYIRSESRLSTIQHVSWSNNGELFVSSGSGLYAINAASEARMVLDTPTIIYGLAVIDPANIVMASLMGVGRSSGVSVTQIAGLAGDMSTPGISSTAASDGPTSVARFGYLTGLVVDGDGNIFVTDQQDQSIRKVGTDGLVVTLDPGQTFGERPPMAVDASGNLFVVDTVKNHIVKLSPG